MAYTWKIWERTCAMLWSSSPSSQRSCQYHFATYTEWPIMRNCFRQSMDHAISVMTFANGVKFYWLLPNAVKLNKLFILLIMHNFKLLVLGRMAAPFLAHNGAHESPTEHPRNYSQLTPAPLGIVKPLTNIRKLLCSDRLQSAPRVSISGCLAGPSGSVLGYISPFHKQTILIDIREIAHWRRLCKHRLLYLQSAVRALWIHPVAAIHHALIYTQVA